ncbi:MAG: hypothetical protein K0U66_01055 [Gammaproteobacteria bacterium]|nr:hypothetical protein [Gammaproteobacteria bacterium]
MDIPINPTRLFQALRDTFDATWLTPPGAPVEIPVRIEWVHSPLLINYFQPSGSATIQVFGQRESEHLLQMKDRPDELSQCINGSTLALLFCDGAEPPAFLLDWCAAADIKAGLIQVQGDTEKIISFLFQGFAREVAHRVSMHGVFLDIYGQGVMVTGKPSVGKSEIALEMISRDHKFIADDLVEFVRLSYDTVCGSCPEITQDMIEVRSLGILNVRRMFGNHTVLKSQKLNFIVVLFTGNADMLEVNRTRPLELEPQKILGIEIPVFPIQVHPGRNLAVLIEACTRSYLLRTTHRYDPMQEIIERQEKSLHG